MADVHLYGNVSAPQLDLESLRPYLTWLPDEFNPSQPESMDIKLNITLVFAGARTAAFFRGIRKEYTPLVDRLNDALSETGQDFFRITIQETYMGDWVYRINNPRFIRNPRSHKEIGMNLDFVAPGNIFYWAAKKEEKLYLSIFEMSNWIPFAGEVVPLTCLRNGADWDRLNKFMDARVKLMNAAFRGLELPFEGKWVSQDSPIQSKRIMSSESPPSPEWWAKNILPISFSIVRRPEFGKIMDGLPLEKHWPVLRMLWGFVHDKYVLFYSRESPDFLIRIEHVFKGLVKQIDDGVEIDSEQLQRTLEALKEEATIASTKATSKKTRRTGTRKEAWRTLTGMIGSEIKHQVNGKSFSLASWPGLCCAEKGYWSTYFSQIGSCLLDVLCPHIRYKLWKWRNSGS
jgi:hypothetical protein